MLNNGQTSSAMFLESITIRGLHVYFRLFRQLFSHQNQIREVKIQSIYHMSRAMP